MELLQSKVETYNPGLKLKLTPQWFSKNLEDKAHSSVVLTFATANEA